MRVKSIKFGLTVGDSVPKQDPYDLGNVGRYLEHVIQSQGIVLQKTGIDIPSLNMEVKTRKNSAKSALTVCRMHVDDIISTDYNDSLVYQSAENLLIVRYCDDENVVTSVEVHNWNKDSLVKEFISSSYEAARKRLAAGTYDNKHYIKGEKTNRGYFEKPKPKKNKKNKKKKNPDSDMYAFRLGKSSLIKMEKCKNSGLHLFDYG
jgi:hypothetical protein